MLALDKDRASPPVRRGQDRREVTERTRAQADWRCSPARNAARRVAAFSERAQPASAVARRAPSGVIRGGQQRRPLASGSLFYRLGSCAVARRAAALSGQPAHRACARRRAAPARASRIGRPLADRPANRRRQRGPRAREATIGHRDQASASNASQPASAARARERARPLGEAGARFARRARRCGGERERTSGSRAGFRLGGSRFCAAPISRRREIFTTPSRLLDDAGTC